jgi:hypothetical protein
MSVRKDLPFAGVNSALCLDEMRILIASDPQPAKRGVPRMVIIALLTVEADSGDRLWGKKR